MADRFYYLEFGGDAVDDVTEAGTDSAGADVSLRVTYDATKNARFRIRKRSTFSRNVTVPSP